MPGLVLTIFPFPYHFTCLSGDELKDIIVVAIVSLTVICECLDRYMVHDECRLVIFHGTPRQEIAAKAERLLIGSYPSIFPSWDSIQVLGLDLFDFNR